MCSSWAASRAWRLGLSLLTGALSILSRFKITDSRDSNDGRSVLCIRDCIVRSYSQSTYEGSSSGARWVLPEKLTVADVRANPPFRGGFYGSVLAACQFGTRLVTFCCKALQPRLPSCSGEALTGSDLRQVLPKKLVVSRQAARTCCVSTWGQDRGGFTVDSSASTDMNL